MANDPTMKVSLHWAAVVRSGKILSIGNSGLGRCTRLNRWAITKHAEMDAINKLNLKERQFRRSNLWSIRWKKIDGKYVLANAKPCAICKEIAIQKGFRNVYYSDENGNILKENLLTMTCEYTTASLINMRDNLHFSNIIFKKNCNVS